MVQQLLAGGWPVLTAAAVVTASVVIAMTAAVARAVQRRASHRTSRRVDGSLAPGVVALLVGVAVLAAFAVAVLGGVRSFDAVSARFGSPAVPLTADGMIVACTALRLAALARGWRLPGSLLVTYVFIVGTVWLNIDAAHNAADKIAHALAPVSYAVLVEMLAHLLRLQLRLAAPARARVTALTWLTSPLVSTRVWLHLARTGQTDPAAARALVQQLIRTASRLRAVCPDPRSWWPFGSARAARAAAAQTLRDGLLSAGDLAALLPGGPESLTPGELLALVDLAALSAAPSVAARAVTVTCQQTCGSAPATSAAVTDDVTDRAASTPADTAPNAQPIAVDEHTTGVTEPGVAVRPALSDADVLAVLATRSAPISLRAAAREFGCGINRARRLLRQAGRLPAADEADGAESEATESGGAPFTGRLPSRQPHHTSHPDPQDQPGHQPRLEEPSITTRSNP